MVGGGTETFQVCVIKVMAVGRQGGVRTERLVGSGGNGGRDSSRIVCGPYNGDAAYQAVMVRGRFERAGVVACGGWRWSPSHLKRRNSQRQKRYTYSGLVNT